MRVSVHDDDPGYSAYREIVDAGKKITVFVDGSPVLYSVTADDELGIVVALTDKCSSGGTIIAETIEGDVRIEVSDED